MWFARSDLGRRAEWRTVKWSAFIERPIHFSFSGRKGNGVERQCHCGMNGNYNHLFIIIFFKKIIYLNFFTYGTACPARLRRWKTIKACLRGVDGTSLRVRMKPAPVCSCKVYKVISCPNEGFVEICLDAVPGNMPKTAGDMTQAFMINIDQLYDNINIFLHHQSHLHN